MQFILYGLTLLVSLTNAGYVYYITNPVEGTTWNVGQQSTVTWTQTSSGGPNPSSVNVVLMVGQNPSTSNVQTLASNVSPTAGTVSFTVPNCPVSSWYFIKIGNDALADYTYSHFFTVNGGSANGTSGGSGSGYGSGSGNGNGNGNALSPNGTSSSNSTTNATSTNTTASPTTTSSKNSASYLGTSFLLVALCAMTYLL